MNTGAQIAFEETAEFFSPMASRNHFQLLTDLTAQAARDVEFSTLIEGFVDPWLLRFAAIVRVLLIWIRKTHARFANFWFSILMMTAKYNSCR
jgi:hypothetical protein